MYRVLYQDLDNKEITNAEFFEKLSEAISFTNKKPMLGRILDLRYVDDDKGKSIT